jgi:hypothetical protein
MQDLMLVVYQTYNAGAHDIFAWPDNSEDAKTFMQTLTDVLDKGKGYEPTAHTFELRGYDDKANQWHLIWSREV